MAARRGFTYLGRAWPGSFSVYGTPIEQASSIWNVIEGRCHGARFVALDCRIGSGKGSWRRTAIAVQSPRDVFGHPRDVFGKLRFPRDLKVDRSGDWAILYQPKTLSLAPAGLMSAEELEVRLDSLED